MASRTAIELCRQPCQKKKKNTQKTKTGVAKPINTIAASYAFRWHNGHFIDNAFVDGKIERQARVVYERESVVSKKTKIRHAVSNKK
jgi:hypothetical protein